MCMGIGVSIFLFAVGAILAWAVKVQPTLIDLEIVGVILMMVSGVGFLVSLFLWGPWGPLGVNRTIIRERELLGYDEHGHEHRHDSISRLSA